MRADVKTGGALSKWRLFVNDQLAIIPGVDLNERESCVEQKLVFEAGKKDLLLDWLEFHLVRDPEFYFSPVISLYYDTPGFRLYGEALNGDYLKTKIRLRWYQATFAPKQDTVQCFVEIKSKFGSQRQKRRKAVALEPTSLSGDLFSDRTLLSLPDVLPEWRTLVRGILVPVLTVEYERYRFVDPVSGARIALDGRIGCSRANVAYVPGAVPIVLSNGVLEVKGAVESLPEPLRPIQRHLRRRSFSKYSRCLSLLIDPLRPGGLA